MKRYLVMMLLLLAGVSSEGQDIHFSQFYEAAILRNPALTGIFSGDYKVGLNYRTQWSNISVPFTTTLVSGEARILVNKEIGDYVSFGLVATYDHAGTIDFNSYTIYPAINYNKSLDDVHHSYLSVGFAGGYIQRSVDPAKMTFSNQYVNGSYSQTNATGETMEFKSIQNYDVAAGVSLNSSIGLKSNFNYYVGVSAFHISKPTQTFSGADNLIKLGMKWQGNLGFNVRLASQYALTVHANYTNQDPYQETIVGGLLSWRSIGSTPKNNFIFYIGAFYRFNDAIIPTVKLDYHQVSATVSYDVNNSSLNPATSGVGGYEFSLFIKGLYNKSKDPTDLLKCPRFELAPESAFE